MVRTHVLEMLKVLKNSSKNWKLVMLVMAMLPFIGCTSTQTVGQTNTNYDSKTATHSSRPFSEPINESETRNFARGNFPLGIGAKFDLAVADEPNGGESSGNVIKDYFQPLRRGKLMSRTPVEMNYTIMPSSGEAFYHSGGLDNEAIKSRYKLQIGMSRHIYKASDFLSADFWLAKGKHNPNKPNVTYRDDTELNPFSDDAFIIEDEILLDTTLSDQEILANVVIPSIR